MTEKFGYYDAIANLIPGTIGCLFLLYTFDLLGITVPKLDLGSLGTLGIGIAIAYTFGHCLQSLASTFEPFYFAIWGGKPSLRLLQHESRHFSDIQRRKMIADLTRFFDISEKCPDDPKRKANFHQRLFERCMALCNRNKLGRVDAFNAVYGFHRVLLTTFVLGFATYITIWVLYRDGSVRLTQPHLLTALIFLTGIGTAIEIFRARKRGYYYAREVLWMTVDYIGAGSLPPNSEQKEVRV